MALDIPYHIQRLQYDSAIAERQLKAGDGLPPELMKKIPTTLAFDNNDFGEETLTGAGTTHNTNGIAIQRLAAESSPDRGIAGEEIRIKRSQQRTVSTPEKRIVQYFGGKKEGPPRTFTKEDIATSSTAGKEAALSDRAYIVSKLNNKEVPLPGWTGFNTLLQADSVPLQSKITYLPVIDASPTDMSTVYTILLKSIQIADQLDLRTLCVVFDQAIYYKAQQIRWKNPLFMERLVIRLGQFHK